MKWYLWVLIVAVLSAGTITAVIVSKAGETAGIVTDPNRMVYTYEWFYNTEADAKAYAAQIVTANQSIADFKSVHQGDLGSYVNSTELSRLMSVAQGLQNELISTVNSYNAAAKDITRGMFRNWNLPTELSATSDGKLIENNN